MNDADTVKVFISHTTHDHRDHTLAAKLAEGLRAWGVQTWIAPDAIPAGDRWEETLVSAILTDCTHFLLILSEASIRAPWVIKEVGLARSRIESGSAIRILPLRVGMVGTFEHSGFIAEFQDVPYTQNFATQLRAITAALALPPAIPVLFRTLIEETTRHFVGRERVFASIQQFLSNERKGCFLLTGDPGQGKTTILAEFVKRTGCPAHFNIANAGIDTTAQFFDSVRLQLSARYDVAPAPPVGENPSFALRLADLFEKAADARPDGEPFVLAIDALDEAAADTTNPVANVLHLPQVLPEGVFLLLSGRRREFPFVTRERQVTFDLMADPAANRSDIERYLRRRLAEPAFVHWLEQRHWTIEQATAHLADRSESNFMYVHYVLGELAAGAFGDASEPLPNGLRAYYNDHWRRMGMQRPGSDLKLSVLQVLALVRGPVSVRLLAAIVQAPVAEVRRIIDEWREFLHAVTEDGEAHYRLYHASFKEFLQSKEAVGPDGLAHYKELIAAHYMSRLLS
jgi:TIR domain-containing protein/AAA ATPase-like protein